MPEGKGVSWREREGPSREWENPRPGQKGKVKPNEKEKECPGQGKGNESEGVAWPEGEEMAWAEGEG